jgi:50S ribosomal protein L16 3-hydroxylase
MIAAMRPTRALLGGLSPGAFLRRHWQKQALLVRSAGAAPPALDRAALCALAARDDVESRLVVRERGRWTLRHGPFRVRDFAALPRRGWTLLVQGVNLHVREADTLLRAFAFVPYARLDDVMVSYAAPGGGVGPHFDSYDVFLLQGLGRRRWRYGAQRDLALRPNLPLRILKRFEPTHDAVLAPGDLLYLPPHYAHDGTAVDECTTWSIGFRAGSAQELGIAFLDFLRDRIELRGRYEDPGLAATRTPARIDAGMRAKVERMLAQLSWTRETVAAFVGTHLSEPSPSVVFEPPETPLSRSAFRSRIATRGVVLDPRTRLLYDERRLYVNGLACTLDASSSALRTLADLRGLSGVQCAALGATALDRLHDWYRDGYLAPG